MVGSLPHRLRWPRVLGVKTFPPLAMASALHTKSKVLTAALSAGWNSAHQELRFANQIIKPKQVKEKEENKRDMRFWRRVEACSLTLESAAWQWTSSFCSDRHWQKNSTQTFLKNTRTSVLKTHSHHTQLSCLSPPPPPLWFSRLILIIEQIFGHSFPLLIVTLSISFYLCLRPFLLSSLSF